MIEEPKAMTVASHFRRPTDAQIEAFRNVPTGFVVDAQDGRGSLSSAIVPIGGHRSHVAGPALAADNRPSDILATLASLKYVRSGDVVVAGAQGFQGCAAAGDRVAGMLKNAGAQAFITDGPMRDLPGIEAVGLPCWCTGLNPGSPFSTGPGRIGFDVQMGSMRIETGDMIVADQDGVVVVPFAQIDAVAARLLTVSGLEQALDREVEHGLVLPEAIGDLLDSDRTVSTDPLWKT